MLFTESYLLKPSQLTGKMNNGEGSEVKPEANRLLADPFTSIVVFDSIKKSNDNKLLAY